MPRPPLDLFHPPVRAWFASVFRAPTRAQELGWPAIARGESTLILAPTGTGKTLAAFLWSLNRVMFEPVPPVERRLRVLYVSPLKALGVDVERNLRVPLEGIAREAQDAGHTVVVPRVTVRSGDTPAADRARFLRESADILITTPESLFLMLTASSRERLRHVDTVIIDEIHALVGGKRGAHLALSFERLEHLRATAAGETSSDLRPLQRIGLSATQRPLDEVARFLGGAQPTRRSTGRGRAREPDRGLRAHARAASAEAELHDEFAAGAVHPLYRPVTIVDAKVDKQIALRIEVPVEAMDRPERAADLRPAGRSIWASIHPRLLDLIRAHTSTLIFVNNRRLAERLAGALNDLAGEALARSHHGSLARDTRLEVEELLKAGHIRALVATSSLELGIDMGAIDLVVQIEAPPSVASGLQRVGRAGHQAGAVSEGVIFPKFRGDLVAAAAVARAMREGGVEATRYPRNPLDVLAQQIVAMAAVRDWDVDELLGVVRQAAPFATLDRRMFENVLDMLSGRYPSDAFAELRPRLTWDRSRNTVTAREGAGRIAIANAGTIPDRGLYGVFLAGAERVTRVGELDEEMVFETRVGDTFTLGASTWRVEEITRDRVLVSPAPGEPGKMPFWHGDQAGRPIELGYAIGHLVRELRSVPRATAIDRLVRQHDLDSAAAEILLGYLDDQAAAGGVPDDRTIVIERCLDQLGDWRVCLLSPLGSRVHAPWAMAATADIRRRTGLEVQALWGDEGFVVRFPQTDAPPDPMLIIPSADTAESLVVGELGATALFAARFREAAARALLLPRRRPGTRTPLWQQRKRAADLLAVAARYGSFPVVLETYREVLRDHFDMPALIDTLRKLSTRELHVATLDSRTPSPFAASLLFNYVANYIYDGDAPLAERRAQALSVDQAQLRELLGDAELRDLLDRSAIEAVERQLQHLDERYKVRTPDALHDLLLRIGDLSLAEIEARSVFSDVRAVVRDFERAQRIVALQIGGDARYAAAEDASRYRDALGLALPSGLPPALLEAVENPAEDLLSRFARSHGPFTSSELIRRFGLDPDVAQGLLRQLARAGRILEGEFRPGGREREWVDTNVLHLLRRRSLARLRREIEPVDTDALARFLVSWHGVGSGRRGHDALLDAVEQLQGFPVPASVLESEVLPARVDQYGPAMLDTLMAAGEVVWVGVEPLGDRDGRVALYLTDHLRRLRAPDEAGATDDGPNNGRAREILGYLRSHGASFFGAIHDATGGGFPQETVDALWELVWRGLVTNDTLHSLRAYINPPASAPRRREPAARFRPRRLVPPRAEGRWSAIGTSRTTRAALTEWSVATAQQLLARHGVVTRETVAMEGVRGGFSAVYPVLKTMEEGGRVRRGYFVAGLGAAQFALPGAVDLLRQMREPADVPRSVVLSATDAANPYGAVVPWPAAMRHADTDSGRGPIRTPGARVILVDGLAAGYLRRHERELLLALPEDEPRRSRAAREVADMLRRMATDREPRQRGMLLTDIDGRPALDHPLAHVFREEGFARSALGLHLRIGLRPAGEENARGGTPLAEDRTGGTVMAQPHSDETHDAPGGDENIDSERIGPSNDRDRAMDRPGTREPVSGEPGDSTDGNSGDDVDPDSARSNIDRDE